ncbi:MAG TPA: alanine--tRNA ligase, partial [Chthoniobacterales bacterium]
NKKDNFWMMGDTGPCGPCSELHVDLTPAGDTRGALVNVGDPRTMEIWNLVFIQFNANPDGTFTPLPARHVDTGMGFERVTAIIQGTKGLTDFTGTISNYETDVFRPIFDEIERLSGKRYASTLPGSHASSMSRPAGFRPAEGADRQDARPPSQAGSLPSDQQEHVDIAFRVIADHIRTLSFAIADGIQPSNESRGYVLRRILRRAVRYGRTLGFGEPFFYKLVDVLVRTMSDVFPGLREKQQLVRETLLREEESFNRTLDRGIELFEREVANNSAISGEFAFRLYDEQGFSLDLTELMARERGLSVDVAGFEKLMEEQRDRARKAQKKQVISVEDGKLDVPATKFLGYDLLETEAVVEAVLPGRSPNEVSIVLDRTACYAEMGGQVGDRGSLHLPDAAQLSISDTQKRGDVFLHIAALRDRRVPEAGESVRVTVDTSRRSPIQRHHTVTHLLHWALHEVVSKDAVQKGSYVGPEKLTFDFNHAALTPEQLRDVEKLVNERVVDNSSVSWIE